MKRRVHDGRMPVGEVAKTLRIDFKTLQKRMEEEGIVPQPGTEDGRLRLLTTDEVHRLAAKTKERGGRRQAETLLKTCMQTLTSLTGRVIKVECVVDTHTKEISDLQHSYDELRQMYAELLQAVVADGSSTPAAQARSTQLAGAGV